MPFQPYLVSLFLPCYAHSTRVMVLRALWRELDKGAFSGKSDWKMIPFPLGWCSFSLGLWLGRWGRARFQFLVLTSSPSSTHNPGNTSHPCLLLVPPKYTMLPPTARMLRIPLAMLGILLPSLFTQWSPAYPSDPSSTITSSEKPPWYLHLCSLLGQVPLW